MYGQSLITVKFDVFFLLNKIKTYKSDMFLKNTYSSVFNTC
jgi:hypothetical protein